MKCATVMLAITALALGAPDHARAQDEDRRPATTTSWGDTGLWFVPTGEVLPSGYVSVSAHRTEEDFRQGNTSVSFFPVTAAVGAGRAEFFGSLRVVTRVDRDTTPLLFANPEDEIGGLVNEFPTVRQSWSGNHIGDLLLGGKYNVTSQARTQPVAFAVRGTVKLPTANEDDGAGTGEYDGYFDVIGSGEAGAVELSAFTGMAWRGDPDNIRISDGWRWGVGAALPARSNLRITAEFFGEWLSDDAVTAPASLIVAEDGSRSPATSRLKDPMTTAVGVTWQHSSGVLLGAAMTYRLGLETDAIEGFPRNTSGDAFGMEFRIGFHRGVRAYVPPPPQVAVGTTGTAPEPEPQAAGPNRAPTVKATCEPCVLGAGGMATLHAAASDPDGDQLTYLWSGTGGIIAEPRAATTHWHAETSPGLMTFTVTVNDGRGGTASDKVTIRVAGGEGAGFEDIHFDFDSSAIRPNEIPNLDDVLMALNARPEMKLLIEGHTCNIGTMEYNLALGERRASAVRTYLMQHGIPASRLSIVSYGEEQPAHDNTQERTRQFNRRAVFVVRTLDADTSR